MKKLFYTLLFIASNLLVSAQAGLIRHYPLDGNANDMVGGFNGTLVGGVTITSDESMVFGTAMSFNGTDGFIELPITGLRLDSFTYSICLKPKFMPVSGQAFACVSIGSSAADQYIYLVKDLLGLQGWGSSSYYTPFVYPPYQMSVGTLPSEGEWYNVVFTTSRDVIKLYVDGILIDTISKAGKSLDYGSASSMQARIGSRAGAPLGNQHFNGVIKDVKIYNRPLDATEIQDICAKGTGILNIASECLPNLVQSTKNTIVLSQIDCDIQHFSCEIFNLLGQPVYTTTNKDFQWNTNGNLPIGQYIYKIQGNIEGQAFVTNKSFFIQ